jgi:hypothetical protein
VGPDAFPELRRYRRVVFEDFEYAASSGDRPSPVCCTALDWRSGQLTRRWLWDEQAGPTFDLTAADLYVAYHAPAEVCCRLVLGWSLPANVLDLCVEYKRLMNGHGPGMGRGLVAALLSHGIDGADFVDKREMQMLAARGGPYTEGQRADLLAYNERDVRALEKLLPRMLPRIDLPRALLRGRYVVEVAKIEHHGIPVNEAELQTLADNWDALKESLVNETNRDYGVWQGQTFKEARWEEYVTSRRWPWPRLKSGRLSLHRDTFRRMAERFPEVEPVRALRGLLSQLRHFELPVGTDGRTRCGSYTFGTITGRNAPEAHDFIFSWPKWCRGLVQPPPGRVLVSLDFSQEEYLIAGTLSGDRKIVNDYRQGDVYVGLGKTLGLIPPGGDKGTHPKERHLCKAVVLACNYGMGPPALARKINRPETVAADLLRRHRETYSTFWRWSDAMVEYAQVHRRLWTRYGWSSHFPPRTKETTLRNWRVQATAGEVLRVAACALGAAGFQIDATVHDSVLLEADSAEADAAAGQAERLMVAASAEVLGEPLRVDCRLVRPGGRLLETGGPVETWSRIWRLLAELPPSRLFREGGATCATPAQVVCRSCAPVQVIRT